MLRSTLRAARRQAGDHPLLRQHEHHRDRQPGQDGHRGEVAPLEARYRERVKSERGLLPPGDDAFRWLTDRMNTSGALESEEDVRIQHSKSRELVVFHSSIYLAPALILMLGFFVNRRKKGRT